MERRPYLRRSVINPRSCEMYSWLQLNWRQLFGMLFSYRQFTRCPSQFKWLLAAAWTTRTDSQFPSDERRKDGDILSLFNRNKNIYCAPGKGVHLGCSNSSPSSLYVSFILLDLLFCMQEGRACPIHVFNTTSRRAHVVFSFLINPLGCKPTHLWTGSLPKGLAGNWQGRRAGCPKVYKLNLSRADLSRGARRKMKEKNLIETAKMQGNVMVSWLLICSDCMTPIKWFRSLLKSLGSIPFPLSTCALTHVRSFGNKRIWRLPCGFCIRNNPVRGFCDSSRPFFYFTCPYLLASQEGRES